MDVAYHIYFSVFYKNSSSVLLAVTDREPGLSSRYGNVPSTLPVISQSYEKLTDTIKNSDISDTSELFINSGKIYYVRVELCTELFHPYIP